MIFFFFNDTATTEIYTLSLHDALPICFLDLGAEGRTARRRRNELNIRTPSIRRRVQVLSGGNQQKVVVAKWLETHAKVLFFDEPARRSEEHTSELQSRQYLVCRLLLEKKKKITKLSNTIHQTP